MWKTAFKKNLNGYGLLKLSSTNFTWSILEYKPLTIFSKNPLTDVWQGPEYTSDSGNIRCNTEWFCKIREVAIQRYLKCSNTSAQPFFRKLLSLLVLLSGLSSIRNSRLQMFLKIGVLRNFANFTGKHLFWILFFLIELQALGSAKFLRTPFF